MVTDKYVFFWGGSFSQWAPYGFIIDGVKYNCCEQYMMAKKALLFGDYVALENIMNATSPKTQKGLGRTIKNFDSTEWNKICRKVVYDANYAKFTQDPTLFDELMGTGNLEIVEVSPEDKIWGIGLHETDERALDKNQWQGTNWLGEVIMLVRGNLKEPNSTQFEKVINLVIEKPNDMELGAAVRMLIPDGLVKEK